MPPNDLFNPNEFTETELVKLIYRDLTKLRQEFDEFRKNDTHHWEIAQVKERISSLELKSAIDKELKDAQSKNMKKFVILAGLVLTIINSIITWFFKH